jgi:hypothetical protein
MATDRSDTREALLDRVNAALALVTDRYSVHLDAAGCVFVRIRTSDLDALDTREAQTYGLRCCELGDAPGEIHDFVLATDYDALEAERDKLRKRETHVRHILENIADPYNENLGRLKVWANDALALISEKIV